MLFTKRTHRTYMQTFIMNIRTSSARQKSKGDNGSPCLTPRLQGKKPTKLPLILIESIAERRIVLIQLTNEG